MAMAVKGGGNGVGGGYNGCQLRQWLWRAVALASVVAKMIDGKARYSKGDVNHDGNGNGISGGYDGCRLWRWM